jgi:capsular polysaccharide biosynthesis protein
MEEQVTRSNEEFIEEGISLQEIMQIIWNNFLLIFLITFWVIIIGVIYTFVIVEPKYTAETSLMVQVDVTETVSSEAAAISVAQNLMSTYEEFVVSDLVLESIVEDIDALDADTSLRGLRESITVSSTDRVVIIYIKVENTDPVLARQIADTLVENSIEIANDDEKGYVLLQDKLKLLDAAKVPANPSSPNKMLNVAISVILGGMIALGVVFLKEFLNNKFKSRQEMERVLNINVIAAVPGTIKERKVVN